MDTFKIRKAKRMRKNENLMESRVRGYDSIIENLYEEIKHLRRKQKKILNNHTELINSRCKLFNTMRKNEQSYLLKGK